MTDDEKKAANARLGPCPLGEFVSQLHELDADEMFDVSKSLRPELTRAEFDATWAEFQELKRRHSLQ